ncbi:unnamed protein product [Phytophthora lilii]|uniref:Unnamed protein product n=1 Tax=Phytophthora lilii TaxID=2077276 RepID=A0A9W6U3F6_9STRA|nr:unnamed protein product [Phytophthora lilii]
MRPRPDSKGARVSRWQHALLGSLVFCGLIYVGLIVSWTTRNSDLVENSSTASLVQRRRHETKAIAINLPSKDGFHYPDPMNSSEVAGSLLRGNQQELMAESSSMPISVLPAEQTTNTNEDQVKELPSNSSQIRRFKCVGWKATAGCSPNGKRLPEHDQDCSSTILDGTAGYCEVEDIDSHERFMVMKRSCAKGYKGTVFRCVDAPGFANFRVKAQQAVDKAVAPNFKLPNTNRINAQQGIVMVVYPKLVASVYATVRALRDVLNCRLPVEIWLHPDEMSKVPGALEPLWDLARNKSAGKITFEAIRHPQAIRFKSKIYAIYNSKFEQALFLDADNVPVRDPTYLFRTPAFVETGAIFWPDFWHPEQTIFAINQTSLVWQLLDMPFVDMFEQESGQLLIHRKRHAASLALVTFYAFHLPNYFNRLRLAWGDKDLFRFAWLKLGAQFHMIETPPAVAGEMSGESFCGMTMAQHDPDGAVIFLHRNQLKLTGEYKSQNFYPRLIAALARAPDPIVPDASNDEYPDPAIWTHLVSFRKTSKRSDYIIRKHASLNKFTGLQRCFGGRDLHKNPNFHTQAFSDLNFAGLETHLREFAFKAAQLQERKRSNM